MAINQYIIAIDSGKQAKFVVSYKNNSFHKLERKSGSLASAKHWDNLMKIIPELETDIETYKAKKTVGTITYTKINKTKSLSLHSQMMDEYITFFERENSLPPKITAIEGAALKQIKTHLQKICIDDAEVLTVWKLIFLQWHKVEAFYAKQMTLKQINSNLSNILIQVKHGNGNQKAQTSANNHRNDLQREFKD